MTWGATHLPAKGCFFPPPHISREHKIIIWLRLLEVPPSRTYPIEAPKSKLICLPKIAKTLLLQHDTLASRFLEKNIKIN